MYLLEVRMQEWLRAHECKRSFSGDEDEDGGQEERLLFSLLVTQTKRFRFATQSICHVERPV